MAGRRGRPGRLTTGLLRCGVVAGPLFVTTLLAAGATRADYNPLRHPVSSLALGTGGWVQVANFVTAGLLCAAGAVGLARAPLTAGSRIGPVLVGAAGIGMVGSGVFRTDPISGYPPGTPDLLPGYSSTGAMLHDLFSVPTFFGLPVAALLYGWALRRGGERGWAMYSAASGLGMLAAFVLTDAAFAQMPGLVAVGGLLQRLTISIGFGWLTALSLHALQAAPERVPAG